MILLRQQSLQQRRGVSVIIGNLLILMASVMMATVVLYWALSFQGGAQSSYSTAIFQSNAQASEGVSIDTVIFDSTSGSDKNLTVYVRNFGDIPLQVAQIYVDGVPYNTNSTEAVVSRSVKPIWVDFNWDFGSTYIVRVATLRGNIYERSFLAP